MKTKDSLIEDLARAFPGRIETDAALRHNYAFDASHYSQRNPRAPLAVAFPSSAAEVQSLVRWASDKEVALVPRGAGTGQTGGAVPVSDAVVVDLSSMNQIREMNLEDLQVVVEPGITPEDLNKALAPEGFFFPPDPGSVKMCALGGMVANNTSGMRAVKYGTTKNYVLGLDVVLPDGSLITTGGASSRVLKNVSGYDLSALFTGSEGTLGIITAIRLRVVPLPVAQGLIMAAFSTVEKAGQGVQALFRSGLIPSALEIMDRSALKAVRSYRPDLPIPDAEAVLLIEMDGLPLGVGEALEKAAGVLEQAADEVTFSQDPHQCGQLWTARRALRPASGRLADGVGLVSAGEDIGVPMSAVPEVLRGIHRILEETGVLATVYGHVGDGNIHVALLADTRDEEDVARAELAAHKLHLLALEMSGTTTAEHGVGISRAQYMEQEHGPALDAMRAIKKALDPKNIMNPGKMGL